MPEGDNIHRLARRIGEACLGQVIEGISAADFPRLQGLVGTRFVRSHAHGKHLLLETAAHHVVHIHLGMVGSVRWHPKRIRTPRRLTKGFVFHLACGDLIGRSIPTLELLRTDQVRQHLTLRQLGPDICSGHFNAAAAGERMATHPNLTAADALLDQTICCGLGNVYKSEILFLERVRPDTLVRDLDTDKRILLYARGHWLIRRNLGKGPRRTRFKHGPRLWVYGRAGERCLICDSAVQKSALGEPPRATFSCGVCQP